MIVVSTGQSTVEQILDSYAQSFVSSLSGGSVAVTVHLRSPASTAAKVQNQLQQTPNVGLCFFGHGLVPPLAGFLADDGNPAVDATSVALLSGRTVAATCCFGNQIGALAAQMGSPSLAMRAVFMYRYILDTCRTKRDRSSRSS